jgi:arylsulfatase A-like enzyme
MFTRLWTNLDLVRSNPELRASTLTKRDIYRGSLSNLQPTQRNQLAIFIVAMLCFPITIDSAYSSPPNIILIVADDLGYGEIGSYGQEKIHTPSLDKMAQEGIRFTQAYSGAPGCNPSRSVLMTGMNTGHTTIRANQFLDNRQIPHLLSQDVTIAELLEEDGYKTGVIGKWGMGDIGSPGEPSRQGFQFWMTNDTTMSTNHYPEFLWKNGEKITLHGNKNGVKTTYASDIMTDKAIEFIEANVNNTFFLYLPYMLPHVDHIVPEDSLSEYRGKFVETPFISEGKFGDQPEPNATVAGMITRLDSYVGRIINTLHRLGIDENTVVFFTSDNGPARGAGREPDFFRSTGPLRGLKGSLYEGGIRIPMIVWWPDHIPSGKVSDFVWSFADVLPTLSNIAGIPVSKNIDGISVLPTLLGQRQDLSQDLSDRFLYWEIHWLTWFGHPMFEQALRYKNWKAHRMGTSGPLELYDLSVDIGESKDVADSFPSVVMVIEGLLNTAREPSQEWPIQKGFPRWIRLINEKCNNCVPMRVMAWFEL